MRPSNSIPPRLPILPSWTAIDYTSNRLCWIAIRKQVSSSSLMRGEDKTQHELLGYGLFGGAGAAGSSFAANPGDGGRGLKALDVRFDSLNDEEGRKWIPPERLLRALLL